MSTRPNRTSESQDHKDVIEQVNALNSHMNKFLQSICESVNVEQLNQSTMEFKNSIAEDIEVVQQNVHNLDTKIWTSMAGNTFLTSISHIQMLSETFAGLESIQIMPNNQSSTINSQRKSQNNIQQPNLRTTKTTNNTLALNSNSDISESILQVPLDTGGTWKIDVDHDLLKDMPEMFQVYTRHSTRNGGTDLRETLWMLLGDTNLQQLRSVTVSPNRNMVVNIISLGNKTFAKKVKDLKRQKQKSNFVWSPQASIVTNALDSRFQFIAIS